MAETLFDVIVVGAGYSGLAASYHLKEHGLDHIIFERGKIGESWRSQRWDSFRFNSTNKLNVLPGGDPDPENPDSFSSAPAFVSALEQYVKTNQLPVIENSKVISIEKPGEVFVVSVSSNNEIKKYSCKQVLIASGVANEIKIPSLAKGISKDIMQLHTSEYKNAHQLPGGTVLVVGSAQSGCQIAEDLLHAGRKVYLSTSMVGRIPRWYRGRDIFYWVREAKFYDIKAEEIEDPKMLELRPPQVTGTGSGRDSMSLQSLSKKGTVILGKMKDANENKVFFQQDAAQHVKFADEFSQKVKKMVDDHIIENNLSAPPAHYDEADIPDVDANCASKIASLDLKENNINSIIWSTGFDHDHSYIKLPVFDEKGKLIHKDGIPEFPGIYFLGYPWLRTRKSPILFGIIEDVKFVVDKLYNYSKENFRSATIEI
ncbi:MAG TPA: NAD(P)/FAD-dependent oxidoreductase [Chitinophagaceae bacterium]